MDLRCRPSAARTRAGRTGSRPDRGPPSASSSGSYRGRPPGRGPARMTITSSIAYSTTPVLRPTRFRSSPMTVLLRVHPSVHVPPEEQEPVERRCSAGEWSNARAEQHFHCDGLCRVTVRWPSARRSRPSNDRPFCFGRRRMPGPSSVASMSTKRFLEILVGLSPGRCSRSLAIGVATATAQGLGGAGTVQGIVKDPTGGVMQAVEVKICNPVSGFSRTTTTDAAGQVSCSATCRRTRITSRSSAQGFQPLERTSTCGAACRSRSICRWRWPARRRPSRSSATPRICSSAIRRRTPTSIRA